MAPPGTGIGKSHAAELRIHWSGAGKPVLFIPGWNTTAETVLSWIPESFLGRFRLGVLEWPGLGAAAEDALPDDLDDFLADLEHSLPSRPVALVGFCLGGVAAWALSQRNLGSFRLVVLVDTPTCFPAVLSPLLVPGLGRAIFFLAQGTALGRACVRAAVLRHDTSYPERFLGELFSFDRHVGIAYLRIFRRYGKNLSRTRREPSLPVFRLNGRASLRALALPLGRRHTVDAKVLTLDGAGHFPAVEAPGVFFERLGAVLDASL